MDWLDKVSAKKGIVGIEVLADGLAVAAKGCSGGAMEVDILHVLEKQEGEDFNLQQELLHFIDKHKLSRRLCHLVLGLKDYQLLLVEAPDVPEEDLREAIRWRIKDLIPMPVEKAVVDVFHLPQDASRSAKKMIYVVVAKLERIEKLIHLVSESGLTLASIDIVEMAMRNISLLIAEELAGRGVGIVRIFENGGVLSLYKDGNLYLSRQFQLAYSGGLLDDLPVDALALEVQRSLDYYERQMGLAPPAALYIGGENISADKVTQELVRSLTVPIHFLDLGKKVQFLDEVDDGVVQLSLASLGGAFREVSTS